MLKLIILTNNFYVFFNRFNTNGYMPVTFRNLLILAIFLVAGNIDLYAQISQGGVPLQVVTTKSAAKAYVEMPELSKSKIQAELEKNESVDNQLKTLHFAHAFEVNLNPSNSGQWYTTNSGYNVWKLTVYSKGAKSINLIFDHFKLPEGARLFVYNENEGEYLGAYTVKNNKTSGKLAVSPVSGDEVTIQYEVPKKLGTPADFEIIRVNHDLLGITKSDRRPLGESGACNVDINCNVADRYHLLKNAVCRLLVNGVELCSGTLLNNTAEDGKPYILSAAHCYDEWNYAETTIYTFNYESPYCAPLDGDPSHTISGAIMKARHDSLDFALAEMSLVPPPEFRPYYAGWDHTGILHDSAVSIHHPLGDIKKIAIDNNSPVKSDFKKEYISQAFLNIKQWEEGVTEIGSSGGGLFNTRSQLIGTLTGGAAQCGNPVNDYFASFAVYWDYKSDSSQQVKYWLDPLKSGAGFIGAKQFYSGQNLCDAFTNLNDNDEQANVRITSGGAFAGYWGGTNDMGITEVVERYSISGDESLLGVSVGVGKIVRNSGTASSVVLKVYEGESTPQRLLYSKNVSISSLTQDAMNYIDFDKTVQPSGTFFVGFDVSNVQARDTFVMYQSLRNTGDENSFYFKLNGDWADFQDNDQGAMCNVMELIACNYDEDSDTPKFNIDNVWIYPNPARTEITIESDQEITVETISVFNLVGQEINVPLLSVHANRVTLDMSGNTPGIYVVRFNYNDSYVSRKFSLVPY